MESSCPPPKGFIAAVDVRRARFLSAQPPFIRRGRSRGRFAVGVRYERQVQDYLSLLALGQPEIEHRNGPWLEFTDKSGRRWCQPDALLVNAGRQDCIIAEVKYQHTADAWWQLKWLYLPVLQAAMPGYSFRLLEIVHWHDPLVAWPERSVLTPNVEATPRGNSIAIHIFNPRRLDRLLAEGHRSGHGDGEAASAGGAEKGSE